MALIEARPYRPFKSSEEYLEAMKEDLAEWLSTLYPDLMINAENFMDRLDTGVALCKHANYVRQAAEDYLARRQARNKSMTRSMTSGLAGPILAMGNVHYLPAAKSGTFFSRDNVSNFITWCRNGLKIIECLLFETDDLIMRKNEKHVILCLLEVARRGAKFGVLAPMLVQMERQIDREIAADNKASQTDCKGTAGTQTDIGIGTDTVGTETDLFDTDSENNDEDDEGPMLMYGPQPQIITNDLKSLDEMVRDLVEKCTCPSQFPMVRVSEGKYRIGDTKVLIFVRILRSHVMVRVGGGWDTLSHYLDKHDPCRCRAQHRSSFGARLIPRTNAQSNGIELHKAQVIYERSPPSARKIISSFNNQINSLNSSPNHNTNTTAINHSSASTGVSPSTTNNSLNSNLSPIHTNGSKTNSRSPTPQRKFLNQHNNNNASATNGDQSLDKSLSSTGGILTSPNLARRSMSPSPRRLIDMRKKHTSLDSNCSQSGPKSLPPLGGSELTGGVNHVQFEGLNLLQTDAAGAVGSGNSNGNSSVGTNTQAVQNGGVVDGSTSGNNKFENISDNGSEISDEGYRSLGLVQSNAQKRESLHSQGSAEDAENNARLEQTSSDSQLSPVDDATTTSNKTPEILATDDNNTPNCTILLDAGPQSLPATFSTPQHSIEEEEESTLCSNKFEQSGVFITDDEITVDIASATGLRKTGFSTKIFGSGSEETDANVDNNKESPRKSNDTGSSKIPRSPLTQRRRRSIDNSTCNTTGSLQDLNTRTGVPVFNRKKPAYRSVRQPLETPKRDVKLKEPVRKPMKSSSTTKVRECGTATSTWSGRTAVVNGKKRPTINTDTFAPNGSQSTTSTATAAATGFERNARTRSSQILYDSNGRRIKGCTTSLTTSPVKNHTTSPLAQQLLEAASNAKNDAQILEKMKSLLSRYSSSPTKQAATTATTATAGTGPTKSNNKKPVYDDFTSAWVHSNGNLERSSSCSPPTKSLSKRSSAASSTESTHSRDMSVIVAPRRERGASKIPAPVRQHTELY